MKYNGNTIKVAWVDLDDTLIDFHANSRAALRRLYKEENLGQLWPDAESWIEHYERHNKRLWELYSAAAVSRDHLRMERFRLPLTEAGIADTEARRLSEKFDPLYLDYLAMEHRLITGAREMLIDLRELGATIGILSNGFQEVQHRKIVSAGLESLIDIVVLSDDIGVNKPDTALYHHAMERSGHLSARNHLMIGDNPSTDIAGALAAGWQAIAFERNQSEPLESHGVYISVNSLDLIAPMMSH